MTTSFVSVVIPAHNEVAYLPRYLPTVFAALDHWQAATGGTGK
ncbi:hypothetical protein [Streptomyces sp. NBC_00162]|nr:hypothetical protein [Streptomyces sp. NBC_00162]UUU44326.1 hypothetical protein JIW86_39675 [Streptomyces sp. NBC_00162]